LIETAKSYLPITSTAENVFDIIKEVFIDVEDVSFKLENDEQYPHQTLKIR
tara:strand:+ start:386 stop:538 length:153 start_codon:yes stop_codon:yes gene_type:complete